MKAIHALFFLLWIPRNVWGRLASASRQQPQSLPITTASTNKFRNDTSLCDRIHPDQLPPECACSEPSPFSLVVECLKPFNSTFFNDTIGMKIEILPCDPDGASVSIDVTEINHNIDYPISGIRANEEQDYPIPGLAVIVPGLGHVGLDVAVLVTGNLDSLTLKIGLNACVALASRTVCASSIPGLNAILPWYVLSGTYKFGDICDDPVRSSRAAADDDDDDGHDAGQEESPVVMEIQ